MTIDTKYQTGEDRCVMYITLDAKLALMRAGSPGEAFSDTIVRLVALDAKATILGRYERIAAWLDSLPQDAPVSSVTRAQVARLNHALRTV